MNQGVVVTAEYMSDCPFLGFFTHASAPSPDCFLALVLGVGEGVCAGWISGACMDWRMGCPGLARLLVWAYDMFSSSLLRTR